MTDIHELTPDVLRWTLDTASLSFETTADLEPLDEILGQERGVQALLFGIGIRRPGYNILVTGAPGAGRMDAVKNVLAIATGISDGLGLGLNARAALITRGLAEITRFGIALGARSETFMGLAGVGDLILTCTGDLSRNRRVGFALASGRPLDAITRELGHVAEGVPTAHEVAQRASRMGVDMPITRSVSAVLRGKLAPREAVEQLMARDPKAE